MEHNQSESHNRIIFVNGTFDLLHAGHLKLLRFAKNLGGFVIVAIDSDERVRTLKGPSRPINSAQDRKDLLLALKYVNNVHIFSSDEGLSSFIKGLSVMWEVIMVKGSDYRGKYSIGQEFCKEVIYVERTAHSSTKSIEDISSRG
jgi:D-beta-D-heptose 7-phosphate kinase/D-beta-D-heptose 1-phosphate adenosyltransferase